MAKQIIASVLEDVVGEYVLNISKENLKVAALRGRIKLENVQLDGDLIGSHVLGAVGLPGFGVLSCWAKSVRMVVSWKNLEKEPTRFEIRGVHLLCVPILPSTSAKTHGAGSVADPRCTLRTRAKRSSLARFERNFLAGRIPGEGPPPRRFRRPVAPSLDSLQTPTVEGNDNDDETIGFISRSSFDADCDPREAGPAKRTNSNGRNEGGQSQNWKAKLRAKFFRNIEISIRDVHVRCEVKSFGLDISDGRASRKSGPSKEMRGQTFRLTDQNAFAFGLILESFVIKTAEMNVESESTEKTAGSSASLVSTVSSGEKRITAGTDVQGSRRVEAEDRHVIDLSNLSIYWDDEPPLLISECAVFKSNDLNLSATKLQSRVAAAMDAMVSFQDPGVAIRRSLFPDESSFPHPKHINIPGAPTRRHDFCISSFSARVRTTLNLPLTSTPLTCLAEFLPFNLNLCVRPHQYHQYRKLRSAILSQQRFDTMLRQRPKLEPSHNPKAWWKYAFACVTTRPNSRPWEDVLLISRSRHRYMVLVEKKLLNSRNGTGYHAGLSSIESTELLSLESLLPIEVLHSFHLLALRNVHEIQLEAGAEKGERPSISSLKPRAKTQNRSSFKLFRRALSAGKGKSDDCEQAQSTEYELLRSHNSESPRLDSGACPEHDKSVSVPTSRSPFYVTVKMYDAAATLKLLHAANGKPIVRIDLKTSGIAHSSNMGEGELVFDVMQFEVFDCLHPVPDFSNSQLSAEGRVLGVEEASKGEDTHHSPFSAPSLAPQHELNKDMCSKENVQASGNGVNLPPKGVVCRLHASRFCSHLALSVSAHPATLVWSKPCLDAVADFFANSSSEMLPELTRQLRNAATPLARKAQLALLSPTALSVNINVAAPKLWVPVSSESSDGAVFIDSGRFKMTFAKQEKETDTNWEVFVSDIQVDFVRGRQALTETIAESQVSNHISSPDTFEKGEIPVIRPFQVHVFARLEEMHDLDRRMFQSSLFLSELGAGPVRTVTVEISPICLNLVDAEVLARAIGKWYAHGLVRVRERESVSSKAQNSRKFKEQSSDSVSPGAGHLHGFHEDRRWMNHHVPTPQSVTVSIKGIEMALQGHSKASVGSWDERYLDSRVFFERNKGSSPIIRTYLVDVHSISVERANHLNKTTTRLTVSDVSVVQLEDDILSFPTERPYHPSQAHYYVLVRECSPSSCAERPPQESTDARDMAQVLNSGVGEFLSETDSGEAPCFPSRSSTGFGESGILSASHLHDGRQHLDEVEIDIDSVEIRVTPTSMKDCAKGLRRILELVQLMTREMERKVHEEGRKAREKGEFHARNRENFIVPHPKGYQGAHRSETFWEECNGVSSAELRGVAGLSDSCILFKVVLRQSALLAGMPFPPTNVFSVQDENASMSEKRQAVVQFLSNALIMFQSIENADASGKKTVHISIDNMAAYVSGGFQCIALFQVPPMIGPTSIEFRVVYATESLGCVVSQDISFDCDAVKARLAPGDLSALVSVFQSMLERLRSIILSGRPQKGADTFVGEASGAYQSPPQSFASSFIHYKKRGTGVATCIRGEVQDFSFVLLRASRSMLGTRPMFDFNIFQLKCKLEGCMSALSGECTATTFVSFFQSEFVTWEHAVEPFNITAVIEQMPNEVILSFSAADVVQLNLTGAFLRDCAEIGFDIPVAGKEKGTDFRRFSYNFTSAIPISSEGHTRTESACVSLKNKTGLHLYLRPKREGNSEGQPDCIFLSGWGCTRLDPCYGPELSDLISSGTAAVDLGLAPSCGSCLGEREFLLGLPVAPSSGRSVSLHKMNPHSSTKYHNSVQDQSIHSQGWSSPVTIPIQPQSDHAVYHTQPVVEWCMQNQRLRSTIADVFSLEIGRDLLSSRFWSPEDHSNADMHLSRKKDQPPLEPGGEAIIVVNSRVGSYECKANIDSPSGSGRSYWLRPYLKNDSPEWTDMTCILRTERERVMLPDDNWIWLNDWTVDLSGTYGECIDADGWEYEADFETFNRSRRYYRRGDSCRRRRWTRTRIMKPPRADDPYRPLYIVWDACRNGNGNYEITVRSHVLIHNCTATTLSFFTFSPSWDEEVMAGSVTPGGQLFLPVSLASAIYLRIAIYRGVPCHSTMSTLSGTSLEDFVVSHRVVMLPTGHTSSSLMRATVALEDDGSSHMHFLVHLRCVKGVIDIFVEPVVRIVNLLPCELWCRLGEVSIGRQTRPLERSESVVGGHGSGKGITTKETFKISTGKEGKCTSVSPTLKPHISLRVPGYQWCLWHRIVNRKANTSTWQPPPDEEGLRVHASKGDSEHAEEYKSLLRFVRIGKAGDPLLLIMSVEVGHCPTIRIYAQYWILDKTGFGCRFSEGFHDLLGTFPDGETSRRSHLLQEEARDPEIQRDMSLPGHQWAIGMSGMTMYFSRKETITLSIETGAADKSSFRPSPGSGRSKWLSPMDVSNVMPKTVVSVDEQCGQRRFELAMSVTVCPSVFARTKLVTLLPRYRIVNLLDNELHVAQDGCLTSVTRVPSQTSVPFHWEKLSFPPKVRLGIAAIHKNESGSYEYRWTNGCIQLDKVGITSMRVPMKDSSGQKPMIVQSEVRLATEYQSSAFVVVIWTTTETSNPLYLLRNRTLRTILCRQPLQDEAGEKLDSDFLPLDGCADVGAVGGSGSSTKTVFECGTNLGPIISTFLGLDRREEFVWILKSGEVACFGFDDPEKPHILEWTYVNRSMRLFDERNKKGVLEVDAMGSFSSLSFSDGREVRCHICAEHSTKVIEFIEGFSDDYVCAQKAEGSTLDKKRKIQMGVSVNSGGLNSIAESCHVNILDDNEDLAFSLRVEVPEISVSIVDDVSVDEHGREILMTQLDGLTVEFSQSREGYHDLELRLMSLQVDNHVHKSIHPVLLFCPRVGENEPFFHVSAVRRLQPRTSTFVFKYAALRLLEFDIFLDRRTAEAIAKFIQPLRKMVVANDGDPHSWVTDVTARMQVEFSAPSGRAPLKCEKMVHTANSGRIYFEQLHLHPVRIGLTFTQELIETNHGTEGMMIFQFIRGMASIANAPLIFTSFVVGHAFESPQTLVRIISTHYSSQLTKQIFGILGSLAILGAPADFISNVGTGVRDFFYEPINGMVHGPVQFMEGLEAGTRSLARGIFVGVVRGAADVTEAVNSNLAGLTADDDFIDERKAHQRMLSDSVSRGSSNRTIRDSLVLAGASVARGVKSGALGIVEQPAMYASKYGPLGLAKGVGKAFVGAVVKPVVGVGDAAVLVMNHVSEATSDKQVILKIPKRLRRALPRRSADRPYSIRLVPYDERAAKAQKIVTGGESVDDVYIGHVNVSSHLVIASDQCLWAIDRISREPWCVSWEEVSHFGVVDGGSLRITVFSQMGLKSHFFHVDSPANLAELYKLLAMQIGKMGNCSSNLAELDSSLFNGGLENLSKYHIPGIKATQVNHVFGSCNYRRKRISSTFKDEIDVIEHCFERVKELGSESPTFFKRLDEEAWSLVNSWGQVFSGLSSRRCITASVINGAGCAIQMKGTKLVEGGSPCYSIPSKEFDPDQDVLHPGGAIIFFGWGSVPNLLQGGSVFMSIETSAFVSDLSDHKCRSTFAVPLPGYQVGFLERSYDENGWWAKYWLLVQKA